MKIFQITSSFKVYFFILLIACGCDIKDNVIEADTSFLKIYDDNLFDGSYIPLDIQQTEDEGYLILSGKRIQESNFVGIRVLKLDKEGHFLNNLDLEPELVHPTANLLKTEEGYYFFCMNAVNLQGQLVKLDDEGNIVSIMPLGNIHYPLAAGFADNGKFVLQSYDNGEKQSILSIIGQDGIVGKRIGFGIGAGQEVEQPIMEHFTRTGKQLPFLAGRMADGMFYLNGFFNYTFSLVFTDLNSATPRGVVQGQQDDGGISALFPMTGNQFALARFNFGDNYVLPQTAIATNAISSSIDLIGFAMPELVPDAKVLIKKVVVNGKNVLLYASNTKNGQILLMGYDELTGVLQGTKYLGYSYPYEIAGFIQTSDEGLAVAALTYAAGRFPRICLFKLSKEELAAIGG